MNGSLIVFMLLFASALVLGRGYCGWVCPAAGCQEAMSLARNKKVTKGDFVKWVLWVPWIGAIVLVTLKAECILCGTCVDGCGEKAISLLMR